MEQKQVARWVITVLSVSVVLSFFSSTSSPSTSETATSGATETLREEESAAKSGSDSSYFHIETRLIDRIMNWDFVDLQEVATGRFARSYGADARAKLHRVEYNGRRYVSRSERCVILEAPWLTDRQFEDRKVARLRLVKREGSWKLENLMVLPRYFSEEDKEL